MRPISRALGTVALTGALLLVVALPAFAHVTLRADNTETGGFAKYTVRVPNESDTGASTTSIEVQLPPGFEEARVQPKPGWTLEVRDGVLRITGGAIGPGQFDEFSFTARNPEQPGDLTFPAIQTYSDGFVQNWTGPEDADQPAPRVTISAAAADAAEESASEAAAVTDAAAAAGGSSAMPVAVAGLVAGVLGLVLGGAAFARSGRRPASAPGPADRSRTSV